MKTKTMNERGSSGNSSRFEKIIALGMLSSVLLSSNQVLAQGSLVINDAVVNLHGGTSSSPIILVVDNQADNAVSASGDGRINSEGQFNILQWNIKDGTGEFDIPFDLGGAAVLSGIVINTAGSNEGFIRYSSYGTGTNNMPLPAGVTTLDHQDIIGDGLPAPDSDGAKVYNRYWFIDAQYATKPAGEISLRYSASEMDGDLDFGTTAMGAQSNVGDAWGPVIPMGTDDLVGAVKEIFVTPATFNSIWTLVEFANPLPITLLSFNAVWGDNRQSHAKVFWSTASEENNDYFDVQRSADGSTWTNIDRVQGAGNSIHTLNYQILDKNPLNGIAYYRLRQVDFDGTVAYTHVVALKREIDGAGIAVYPNPATNQFQVAFEGFQSETANINILDNSGRKVLSLNNNVINNPVQIINASNFQSGVYYIHVTSESESFIEKIVIAH